MNFHYLLVITKSVMPEETSWTLLTITTTHRCSLWWSQLLVSIDLPNVGWSTTKPSLTRSCACAVLTTVNWHLSYCLKHSMTYIDTPTLMTKKVRKNEHLDATYVPSIDRELFKLSLANSTDSRKRAIAGTSCMPWHSSTTFKIIFLKNAKVYIQIFTTTLED